MALVVKNLSDNARDLRDAGSIPELGRSPGGGHGNPLQYSCLEDPCGQRSLAGYSPWDRKESDTTERLSTLHSTMYLIYFMVLFFSSIFFLISSKLLFPFSVLICLL